MALQSPSRRHLSFRNIPTIALELELHGYSPKAIRTVFKLVGYGRRISKRKSFSEDPAVIGERLAFAQEGIRGQRAIISTDPFRRGLGIWWGTYTKLGYSETRCK